jgi:hypothetical protein
MNDTQVIIGMVSSLVLITICYFWQLSIVVRKLNGSHYYTSFDNIVRDLVPWMPYYIVTIFMNMYIFVARIFIELHRQISFSINKIKSFQKQLDLPNKK